MNDASAKTIGTAEQQITFTPGKPEYLRFLLNQRPVLCLGGAMLNQLSESGALLQKSRQHQTLDGLVARFEATLQIPFGAEPEIRRSVEFVDGITQIIEDYQPGKRTSFKHLKLGDITLPGPWINVHIVLIAAAGQPGYAHCSRHRIDGTDTVLYDSHEPFLSAVFEHEDGLKLEIGCGDDLWRWRIAEGLEHCHAQFKISGNREQITLERIPLTFDEDAAPECVSRRFKWYFAWTTAEINTPPLEQDTFTLDINKFNLPGSAMATDGSVKPGSSCCLQAAATRRLLRKKLRSVLAKHDTDNVFLTNLQPHVCADAAHLGRPGKQLLHWDVWDLMELFIWGNRQIAGTNRFFGIIAPDNASPHTAEMPLMQRFSQRKFRKFTPETGKEASA